MLVSLLAVALNLLFNWIFTFRLGWGHRGLAFSTGCIATVNFLLLYALMRRHLPRSRVAPHAPDAGEGCRSVGGSGGGLRRLVHWLLADWETQTFRASSARSWGQSSWVRWCSAVRRRVAYRGAQSTDRRAQTRLRRVS